jgi:hypothetical protein
VRRKRQTYQAALRAKPDFTLLEPHRVHPGRAERYAEAEPYSGRPDADRKTRSRISAGLHGRSVAPKAIGPSAATRLNETRPRLVRTRRARDPGNHEGGSEAFARPQRCSPNPRLVPPGHTAAQRKK